MGPDMIIDGKVIDFKTDNDRIFVGIDPGGEDSASVAFLRESDGEILVIDDKYPNESLTVDNITKVIRFMSGEEVELNQEEHEEVLRRSQLEMLERFLKEPLPPHIEKDVWRKPPAKYRQYTAQKWNQIKKRRAKGKANRKRK